MGTGAGPACSSRGHFLLEHLAGDGDAVRKAIHLSACGRAVGLPLGDDLAERLGSRLALRLDAERVVDALASAEFLDAIHYAVHPAEPCGLAVLGVQEVSKRVSTQLANGVTMPVVGVSKVSTLFVVRWCAQTCIGARAVAEPNGADVALTRVRFPPPPLVRL
jgi:hypothetical protein